MHWPTIRQWALLAAGALISLIGSLFIAQWGFSWTLIILLLLGLLILLIFGGSIDERIRHRYHLWARNRNPKIGILNDMGWESGGSPIATWTSRSPEQWQQDIEKHVKERGLNARVCLITVDHNFDPYTIVVNPYGGAYPEKDVVDQHTLNRILRYVKDRGLFVNVADIPGYWAYNVLLRRRVLAVPLLRTVIPQEGKLLISELPLFSMVPWMQKLGLSVHNTVGDVTTGIGLQVEVAFGGFSETKLHPIDMPRAAKIEDNMRVILGHPRDQSGQTIPWGDSYPNPDEVTPMFFASYGDGEFLICMLKLDSHQPTSAAVTELLVAAILDKLKGKSN